jgi:ABC-type multidrug transport system fused ATPase/permease subunit
MYRLEDGCPVKSLISESKDDGLHLKDISSAIFFAKDGKVDVSEIDDIYSLINDFFSHNPILYFKHHGSKLSERQIQELKNNIIENGKTIENKKDFFLLLVKLLIAIFLVVLIVLLILIVSYIKSILKIKMKLASIAFYLLFLKRLLIIF